MISLLHDMFSVGAIHPFNSPLAPPSNQKEVFWVAGIHPFNSPLPTTQNGKRNLKIF